ncbi:MAG: fused MFS/spermidine synthase, partial [Hyphomonadaceae bacterium]
MSLLFLTAYTCSGLAGLVYEVSWTRLLTLYIGHTTAAASAVVAAFLGGLAVGAAGGGVVAARLRPSTALRVYAGLELVVALFALALPWELQALTPLLRWAYADGAPGWLFPLIRLVSCLALVFAPAAALGATFPMAVRWFAHRSTNPARVSSVLYSVNTVGATAGSLLAGFTLIPSVGISGTTHMGMLASALAAALVGLIIWRNPDDGTDRTGATPSEAPAQKDPPVSRGKRTTRRADHTPAVFYPWLAATMLGLSGFAALVHEIVWTRILALVLGPTTYAFSAALAAVVAGIAVGSGVGAWLVGRLHPARRPGMLALVLTAGALTIVGTSVLAGSAVPAAVARQVAASPDSFTALLRQGMLLTASLILPTAVCLGAAFPFALSLAGDPERSPARQFGVVYAVNTIGSVAGTLAAGFLLIPALGLPATLSVAAFVLI